MSDRIAATFARTRAEGRAALVVFVTGGDPSPAESPAVLDAVVEAGADIIELGFPFTDPMADGPAIQRANLRALGAGTRTVDLLAIARDFRNRHPHVPLIAMGYANTLFRAGAKRLAEAGVDGVICVDVPPEEDDAFGAELRDHGLHLVRLATPTTDAARLPAVLNGASGFLYYVSVAGITGMQQAAQASIEQAVARLKAATVLPVAVGFGIRSPEQAAAVARVADGVVVGSAIVDAVGNAAAEGKDPAKAVGDLVAPLAAAVRSAVRERAA
jgi:tryptophan synthase alpha chain